MSLMNDIVSAWQRKGPSHVISQGPNYLLRRILGLQYNIFTQSAVNREELVSYAEQKGRLWYYDSATTFQLEPPINNRVSDNFKNFLDKKSVGANFVCEIPDAKLIGPDAIPQTTEGQIVTEVFGKLGTLRGRLRHTVKEMGQIRTARAILGKSLPTKTGTNYEVAAHLVARHRQIDANFNGPNYGHWINENLPQLQAIEYYSEVTGNDPILLVNSDPPPWLPELIEFMGYSEDDWVEWTDNAATVEKLVIPQLNYIHSNEANPNPVGKQWVRRRALENLDESAVNMSANSRIFLSRQGAEHRKILNFDEISEVLKEYGFSIVRPEELSVQEEVYLFSEADVIAGVAGSNIAGIIFSSDATLVEILPVYMPVYHTLANEMNLNYRCIYNDPSDIDLKDSDQHKNMVLDPSRLRDTLDQTLENTTNGEII
jgi:hypothetical protein